MITKRIPKLLDRIPYMTPKQIPVPYTTLKKFSFVAFPKPQAVKHGDELAERTPPPPQNSPAQPDASIAPPEAQLAAAAGDVEEAAAPLVAGSGQRRRPPATLRCPQARLARWVV
jgi:hypothetical protein